MQSRLHFRIHAAQTDIRSRLKAGNNALDEDESGEVEDADEAAEFLDAEEELNEPFVLKDDTNANLFRKHITEQDAVKILETQPSKK